MSVTLLAFACGGTVQTGSSGGAAGSGGSGGTSKGGSAGSSGSGGVGGSGTAGSGGFSQGGTGPIGGQGGSGGCLDMCGPDGAACCFQEGSGCGYGDRNGFVDCMCARGIWMCTVSGAGGAGAAAGFGGTSGCTDASCGPDGVRCCYEGSGCADANTGYSCSCVRGLWRCGAGSGGVAGSAGVGGSAGSCDRVSCDAGLTCCGGTCVNTANDPYNCGGCGVVCGSTELCAGTCSLPGCSVQNVPPGAFCCGSEVCTIGTQLCCVVQRGGPIGGPSCFTPTPDQPTCPVGCPLCL